MITNVSDWFGASSSVPSSGCPCSLSTSLTSGNFSSASRMSRSTSAPRSSDTALGIVTVMWMSPSFIGGRNSEPEARDQHHRAGDHRQRDHRHQGRPAHGHAQRRRGSASCSQVRNGGCFSSTAPVLEQHRRQRRHGGQREQQRARQRERVGQRDGPEDAPLDPLQREDRHHRGADDRHREQRRAHDLLGGLGDDVRRRSRAAASRSPGGGRRSRPGSPRPPAGCRSRSPPSTAGLPARPRSRGRRTRSAAPAASPSTPPASRSSRAGTSTRTMLTSTMPSIMLCDTVSSVVSTSRVRS